MTGEWRGCRDIRMVSKTRSGMIYSTREEIVRGIFVWNPQSERECKACGEVVAHHDQLRRCRVCIEYICKKCRHRVRVPAVRFRPGELDRETGERQQICVRTYGWDNQCKRFHHYPGTVDPIILGTHERPITMGAHERTYF